MNTEAFFRKNKEFYAFLLKYIEESNDSENEFQKIDEIINERNILEDKTQIFEVLKIISKIWNNYHRTPDLFNKLDKILKRILHDQNCTISNNELFQIFKDNKLLLLHLFKNDFFQYDQILDNDILKNKELCTYLYPSIKPFLNESHQKEIEEKISELKEDLESFEKKCHKGENDSPICLLIQQDSIEDFITYVNRTNLSLSSTINPTIFETNPILNKKQPSLIEYAAFYGSIQIIRYLQFNKVQLNGSLWLYAIHSKNPELIQFLEENHVVPFDQMEIIKEAIICHHNNIADYIIDNMLQQNINKNELIEIFGSCIGDSKNYYFYPDDIQMFLCKDSFNVSGFIDSFEEFTISSSVISIGESVFRDCSSLKKIEIPSSVTSIGNNAFYDCLSLEQITIPFSVTSINNGVFHGCSSLKEIEIPSSVTSIGNNAFYDCLSLEKITIPSSVVSFGKEVFEGVISLEIKGSIQSIPRHLFNLCSSIERIVFSSSVTSIDRNAFDNCISLEQVIIQSPLTSIEPYTFYGCISLENISIPSSVTSIGRCAFSGCSSIESIEIPSSVTSIASSAFNQCQSLKQISIPSSIISIEEQTFFGCSSLKEIVIPSYVVVIGNSAFYNCKCLKSITIPNSVTIIYGSAFSGCKCLKKITIPASVTLIGDAVFVDCINLRQVTILSSNPQIGNRIFAGCYKLKQISLPSSIDVNLLQVKPDVKITII